MNPGIPPRPRAAAQTALPPPGALSLRVPSGYNRSMKYSPDEFPPPPDPDFSCPPRGKATSFPPIVLSAASSGR